MESPAETTERLGEVEQIYRTRLPELCRVAAAISGSRQAAPDLVQEAFVRAVGRLDSYRGDGSLDAWVWRIVVNVASNGRREPPPSNCRTTSQVPTARRTPPCEHSWLPRCRNFRRGNGSSCSCTTTPTSTTPPLPARCRSAAAPSAQPSRRRGQPSDRHLN